MPVPARSGSWLIVAGRDAVAQHLAERLRARGDVCTLVDAECSARELTQLLAASPAHVVHCAGTELMEEGSLSAASLLGAEQRLCGSLLQLAQLLSAASTVPHLTVLTRGAMSVPGDTRAPAIVSAPVLALGRSITRELPRLNCACIDLDPAHIDFAALCTQLSSANREELSVMRGAAS